MDRMAELGVGDKKAIRLSIDRWLYSCTSRLKSHLTASVGLPTHINTPQHTVCPSNYCALSGYHIVQKPKF